MTALLEAMALWCALGVIGCVIWYLILPPDEDD